MFRSLFSRLFLNVARVDASAEPKRYEVYRKGTIRGVFITQETSTLVDTIVADSMESAALEARRNYGTNAYVSLVLGN